MQALKECTNRHELNKTLDEFPEKIADVYTQTWIRILNQSPGKVALAGRVLAWVLYATRSLTVNELRHAVATCPDTHKLELRRLAPIETLLSVCCGLLVSELESDLVRLVRKSFEILSRDTK
jgi:ankyrin repeat domain-containing protein 50